MDRKNAKFFPKLVIRNPHLLNAEEKVDALKQYLEQQGLLSDEYVYTGIDGSKTSQVLKHGIDDVRKRSTHLFMLSDFNQSDETPHPLYYAERYPRGAVVVYSKEAFVIDGHSNVLLPYLLKEGKTFRDALVAVFAVNYV